MQASGESRDDKLMNHTSADRGNGSVAAADRSNGSVAAADRGNGSVAAADRGNGSVAAAEHVQEFSGVLPVSLDAFDLLKEKLRTLTDSTKLGKIILAAEEAFVNIVQYSGAGTIEYVLQKNNQFLTLILSDDGVSFDPFCERPAKDFDDFDTGGMGISLIRQITEQARWERKAEKNRLTLVFSL